MRAINYDAVLDLLLAAGLVIEGPLQINSDKIVRTRVVDQPRGKRPGWYRLWEVEIRPEEGAAKVGSGTAGADGGTSWNAGGTAGTAGGTVVNDTCILGAYGLFLGADQISHKVPFPRGATKRMDPAALEAARARQRMEAQREEAARKGRAARAAQQAAAWWGQCQDGGRSPYLERKGFAPGRLYGARISPRSSNLVIPLLNGKGQVQGLQVIYHDPEVKKRKGRDKDFAPPGLAKAGHWYQIGSPHAGGVLLLCEGFATGASLHEATALPVVIAFDAGNLAPVAKALAARYRGARVLICADDDYLTMPNTGVVKAQEAALSLGDFGRVAVPNFAEPTPGAAPIVRSSDKTHKGPTDFNDLHVHPQGGLHVVRAQIELALATAKWGALAAAAQVAATGAGPRATSTHLGSGEGRAAGRGAKSGMTGGGGQAAGQGAGPGGGHGTKPDSTDHGADSATGQGAGLAGPDVHGSGPAGSPAACHPATAPRPEAVSNLSLNEIVERFVHIDDATGEFAFDYWTNSVVRKTKIIHMLPARVRWDDVKDHPRWKARAVYIDQVGFDPGHEDPNILCNRWSGWPTVPKAGCCDMLLNTLRYLTEHEPRHVYEWILRWLAYPLQYPGAKLHTALVFHGQQGTGKSRFFESYARIYGEYGQVLNQGALEDKFNSDWTERKLFVVCDEVAAKSEIYTLKNQLKNLITGEWVRVNPKNIAAHRERNHMNLCFLSNEGQPLILEPDDRRHCVIYTPRKLDESWYDDLSAEIANGGIEALHHHLLHLDLGDFKPWSKPPATKAKEDLIDISRESVDRFLRDWQDGHIDGLPLCPAGTVDVYQAYLHWCRREGVRYPRESNQFAGFVTKQPGWTRAIRDRYEDGYCQGPPKRQRLFVPSDELMESAAAREANPGQDLRRHGNETQTQWITRCFLAFRNAIRPDNGGYGHDD